MNELAHRLSLLLDGAAGFIYPNLIFIVVGAVFLIFGISRRRSS